MVKKTFETSLVRRQVTRKRIDCFRLPTDMEAELLLFFFNFKNEMKIKSSAGKHHTKKETFVTLKVKLKKSSQIKSESDSETNRQQLPATTVRSVAMLPWIQWAAMMTQSGLIKTPPQ